MRGEGVTPQVRTEAAGKFKGKGPKGIFGVGDHFRAAPAGENRPASREAAPAASLSPPARKEGAPRVALREEEVRPGEGKGDSGLRRRVFFVPGETRGQRGRAFSAPSAAVVRTAPALTVAPST